MNENLKNMAIPFILMIVFYLCGYYLINPNMYGGGINVYLGILFISGLFFGPLGCFSASVGNFCCDIYIGYSPLVSLISLIISFSVSYFAYKLWYTRNKYVVISKPRINTVDNVFRLLGIIFVFSVLYSIITTSAFDMMNVFNFQFDYLMVIRYFVNCINFSLLFSIAGMTIARFKDFTYTPRISKKKYDKKRYTALAYLLTGVVVLYIIINYFIDLSIFDLIFIVVMLVLIWLYSTIPIKQITKITFISIPERIMGVFVIITLIVTLIHSIVISLDEINYIPNVLEVIASNQQYLFFMMFLDLFVILFFFPALFMLKYIEMKLIKPIDEFSKIKEYIKEDEKIETAGLLKVYSEYIDQDDEIGVLSRSYTNLITNNNKYIENLKTLEGEKQRIKTELNIAHNIQAAILPRCSLDDDYVRVDGYCLPAKEVGGDFYDFYEVDEDNVVVIIGDASGKGVPAAIFSIIIQNSIKLLINNENDPAKVLYEINNQICENNSELMFITLFLAIYNKKSHILTYTNAGHNFPIIKNNGVYEFVPVDSAIALGVIENFEFTSEKLELNEELLIYTDGITDALNEDDDTYGEERFLEFINKKSDSDNLIHDLNGDVHAFCGNTEQFDDMTLLWLKIKK